MKINGDNYQKFAKELEQRREVLLKSFPTEEFGNEYNELEKMVEAMSYPKDKYLYNANVDIQTFDLDKDKRIEESFSHIHYYHDFEAVNSYFQPCYSEYGAAPTEHDIIFHSYINSNNSHHHYFRGSEDYFRATFVMEHENYENKFFFVFRSKEKRKIENICTVFDAISVLRTHGRHCATRGIGNLVGFAKIIAEVENPDWQGGEAYPIKDGCVAYRNIRVELSEISKFTKMSGLLSTCIPFAEKEDASEYLRI